MPATRTTRHALTRLRPSSSSSGTPTRRPTAPTWRTGTRRRAQRSCVCPRRSPGSPTRRSRSRCERPTSSVRRLPETPGPPPSSAAPPRRSRVAWRSSTARDLELAPEVEAGDLLEHVRSHRPPPLRLHLRQPVPVARLHGVPDRDSHHLVPVGRDELVRPEHSLGELARPPGAAELLSGARLELPARDPDVCAVELHPGHSLADPQKRQSPRTACAVPGP